ncbi:MAG: nuclear transport factor 2 family protein [Cyclobacteriaceae bacterium]|nr:nuclear transport factor 2 family protein [Cyclobacteriaceae bacterium]
MKHNILILLLFISSCCLAQTNNDSIAITQVLKNTYKALGNYDVQSYLENCAEDYLLVENGNYIWTLEQEIDFLKKNQHRKKTRTDKFKIHSLKIENSFAYAVYDLWSEIKEGNVSKNLHWIESCVFRKVGEKWKVVLIHSTKIED